MYQSKTHLIATKVIESSLLPHSMQERYLSILPFLPEEKVQKTLHLLQKSKFLTEPISSS